MVPPVSEDKRGKDIDRSSYAGSDSNRSGVAVGIRDRLAERSGPVVARGRHDERARLGGYGHRRR